MEFKIGTYYNFSTYAPSILGQEYKKLLLMAIGDYKLASMFDNVDIKQNAVQGYLPSGSNTDASKESYLVFRTETQSIIVFAMSWINMSTIESAVYSMVVVTVESASAEDATRIRQILAAAGYNKVTTSVTATTTS